MNLNNCVISEINGFAYQDKCIPTKEAFIEYVNEIGIKYLDLYCIIENIKTKEKHKMKLRIQSDVEFVLDYVSDEEWEKYCLR